MVHLQYWIVVSQLGHFFADTKTFDKTNLMNEKYPIGELSDIPTYINDKISAFIKTNPRFKINIK